ncbi:hypothetical protein BCV69DRAFT_32601 [Microstroma glucosiphilum]|uniref:GRAM domain-containing protein n=1 Tax=Pseudomicrostroma glucosiphilum TaxID=1684307 RepID=A0A316U3G9_9BASI|nr:hypothetical protein BCV69DRAFT_32601 [Pseudomicrostroma glucosiphilum]PWN19797.1 hypothetical protein BCV69DRAFT_32601 [Pseudomicrostroma glucosiphilum]
MADTSAESYMQPGRLYSRRHSAGSYGNLEDVDEVDAGTASPTKRRSPGKVAQFFDKLRPTHKHSGNASAGLATDQDAQDPNTKSLRSSRNQSGKDTPAQDAQGDFGQFIKAAELKERLEVEKIREVEEELKLAKKKKKKGGKSSAAADHSRPPSADALMPSAPPLEDSKEFPGGFGDDAHPRTILPAGTARNVRPKYSPRDSRQTGTSSSFNVCGADLSSDENDEVEDNVDASPRATTDTLVDEAGGDNSGERGEKAILQRSGSSSSISSSGSLVGDYDDALPMRAGPQEKSASIVSLKSWGSSASPDTKSLASGGADPRLAAPLLELEELELKSFLKNFNRHTREIRVPASAHFPRRRMPRWDDFVIPPGEAALAAREGKRVTVLTHVDRGLQTLAREEGEGGPEPRPAPEPSGKKSKKQLAKSHNAADEELQQKKVTWAPETGFMPEGLSTGLSGEDEISASVFGGGLRNRTIEKSERKAKEMESGKEGHTGKSGSTTDSSARAPLTHGLLDTDQAGTSDIHDDRTELRPSRDTPEEAELTEGTWELIDGNAEHEAIYDASGTDRVDGVAFCIAYILALVERYAPEELDNTPDQTYREGRARSHLERLYIIAPFWERLGGGLRKLYRWDNPRRSATAAMIYFVLWWTDLLPTAFFLMLIYYILQFRFFPPEASFLHERVRDRMARGVEADKLAERLRRRSRLDILEIYRRFTLKYGLEVQLAAGDIADFHEKVKNLILWRNPQATWRTLALFCTITVFVTFAPAYYIWKAFFFFTGFTFFCLLPLQSHYPRYRRPLSPAWWALWGSPTDAQFAVQILRRRHLERAQADLSKSSGKDGRRRSSAGGGRLAGLRSEAAHAVKGGAMRPMKEKPEEALFGLEEEIEGEDENGEKRFRPKKLGSFFCQHHGVPGHLTITTRQIYFRGLGRSKTCKTPLEEVAGLAKTKSLQLFVWYSSGLQIARSNKRSLFFSNMVKRDECFNLILAVGSEVWTK